METYVYSPVNSDPPRPLDLLRELQELMRSDAEHAARMHAALLSWWARALPAIAHLPVPHRLARTRRELTQRGAEPCLEELRELARASAAVLETAIDELYP